MRIICWRTKRWEDNQCDDCDNDCSPPRTPSGYVAVPEQELKNLEEARIKLYDYLEGKLTEQEILALPNITGQIWKVANRKQWD